MKKQSEIVAALASAIANEIPVYTSSLKDNEAEYLINLKIVNWLLDNNIRFTEAKNG